MDFGWGVGHYAAGFVQLFIAFLTFTVFVVLAVLLARFLIVATRAAQLYVHRHETRDRQTYDAPSAGDPGRPAPENPGPDGPAPTSPPA